ncbi:uncharacterized protein LOC125071831 [Vanessa atalanta]|uniref:uncharacterized protein LOC125071831 n=1 Tax=Vanessa atalanta TaxID=42275 RepID=UPI001FCDE333|nr:uncharacterized protein LOC125071831 [Vanessa atalanta]
MGPLYLIIALLIQNSYTETITDNEDNQIESVSESIVKEYETAPKDWMDMFKGSSSNIFPTSSATLMAQATFSDKSPEEQLEEIKGIAEHITKAIQSEMANLLSYAISITDKEVDNTLRSKRSVETPMDSTQLVMRLLKHIKSNNEYQNIAIEKMMTAQEIADKYGIDFNPDPQILSDLALAANEQAEEMSEILKDACDLKNVTKRHDTDSFLDKNLNSTQNLSNSEQKNTTRTMPDVMPHKENENSDAFSHYNYYYNYPYESQIPAPPTHHHHNAPVSPRPDFYDYISFNPALEYSPYCSMEPMSSIFYIDEPVLSEPELVGEEFEEIISSKVYIDHDEEPGMSSVNHVMTYTISEKSHFRTPQIESLPQQMQYYFFLM